MADNILIRLHQLKLKDRAVKSLDLFSPRVAEQDTSSEPEIRKELKVITDTLEDMSILQEQKVEETVFA